MSVAYEIPPRVRRVRPQASAVVLPFPRSAPAPAQDRPANSGPSVRLPAVESAEVDVVATPADLMGPPVVGSRVDRASRADGPRGPVECPSSRPARRAVAFGAHTGPVRLTARGRRLRALVCACAFVAAGWIVVSAVRSAITTPVIPPSAPAVVQVHQGDTLWSIATRVAPRHDPRRVVDALRSANHLDSNTVRPGQRLHIPR